MAIHTVDNTNFTKWARSLSGCDGGNPESPIWLCGIEWGYAKRKGQSDDDYNKEVSTYYEEITSGELGEPPKKYDWAGSLTYPFGISVAKLYTAWMQKDVKSYSAIKRDTPPLFKLNLYPIAFRSLDHKLWKQYELEKKVKFESKECYLEWCRKYRFPYFFNLTKIKNPKLIIGVGITHRDDFSLCFAGKKRQLEEKIFDEKGGKRRYFHQKINDGKTTLVVIPQFKTRYGLNSDSLLKEMGVFLAELVSPDCVSLEK